MLSKPALAAFAIAVLLGASACGKDAEKPKANPSPTVTASPTATSTPSTSPSASSSATSPALGLPDGFPAQDDVPLVSGLVTSKTGGTSPDGRVGWVIELESVGSQKQCFDKAAAALVAAGFKKHGELTAGDTRQAQFTTAEWAVIISSRADGENCHLGYEVGQLSP